MDLPQPERTPPPAFQSPISADSVIQSDNSGGAPMTRAQPADDRTRGRRDRESGRLHLVLALSIAIVSVLGAVVAWRAEVHDARAGEFNQSAVAASLTAAKLQSQADATASTAAADYARYQRFVAEASRLDPGGCPVQRPQTLSEHEAGVACELQVVFSGYNDASYIQAGKGYRVARYAADVAAFERLRNDADPAPYQALADQARHREDELLLLSIGLVVTLALLTLARVTKSSRRILILAIPGWLLLVGGAAILGAWEM